MDARGPNNEVSAVHRRRDRAVFMRLSGEDANVRPQKRTAIEIENVAWTIITCEYLDDLLSRLKGNQPVRQSSDSICDTIEWLGDRSGIPLLKNLGVA